MWITRKRYDDLIARLALLEALTTRIADDLRTLVIVRQRRKSVVRRKK